MVAKLQQALDLFAKWVAWLIFAMTLITVSVVFLRYVLRSPSILQQELVAYMHAFLFMMGLTYTLKSNEHVRVDVFFNRFSEKRKALINLLGHLLLLIPVAATLAMGSLDYVADSWRVLEKSDEVRGIPAVFLLKTVIPVAFFLLIVQALLEIQNQLSTLRKQ